VVDSGIGIKPITVDSRIGIKPITVDSRIIKRYDKKNIKIKTFCNDEPDNSVF